jgi:predicted RNase H-like HicB family nuclease/DNA-binding XRE family transcriptional regulator
MNYHFKVHKEDNGFWAECYELSGCVAEANTLEQLKKECKESLNLYLEEPNDSKMIFPLPSIELDGNKKLISVGVEPEIALAILLKYYRSNSKMTQKQVSEMLGMKNVYSYQRLEKRSNPTLHIMEKIHTVFPDIKFEYIFQ